MNWLGLASRCESGSGEDRELDRDIDLGVGGPQEFFGVYFGTPAVDSGMFRSDPAKWSGMGCTYASPRYTTSLDAITALIERELPGCGWSVFGGRKHISATIAFDEANRAPVSSPDDETPDIEPVTHARALCAAFCRAKHAMENGNG